MPTVTPSSAVDPIKELGLESLFGAVREQADSYRDQTRREARRSFIMSWTVMVVGFAWLAFWSVWAVWVGKGDVRWVAEGLGVIGAVLSAYITRTFLSLHGTCLAERRYYQGQLLAMDLLFQAERLANVTPEKKGELYVEIVRALIRGAERILPETLAREPSPPQKSRGDPGAGPAVPQAS